MAETLQTMYDLPEELPLLSQRARRGGYNLDGEWTRWVWSCHCPCPAEYCVKEGKNTKITAVIILKLVAVELPVKLKLHIVSNLSTDGKEDGMTQSGTDKQQTLPTRRCMHYRAATKVAATLGTPSRISACVMYASMPNFSLSPMWGKTRDINRIYSRISRTPFPRQKM